MPSLYWRWGRPARPALSVLYNQRCRLALCALYARPMAAPGRDKAHTLRRLHDGSGLLAAAAMRKLDETLPWYRALPAEDRSWVGLVAQAGINAFVSWFSDPSTPPHGVGEIFAAAPPELTRSISLQHTLQLVRGVVDVVETHSDQLAAPGGERDLREAVLR